MGLRPPGFVASVPELRDVLEAGLRLDPPQSGFADERWALEAQGYLQDAAVDLADAHWDAAALGDAPAPADLGRHAVYEVLAATAAQLSWEETGHVDVGLETAGRAVGVLGEHLASSGMGPMLRAFCTTAMYENLQAVDFYQPMAESVFVSGAWHRPWAGYPLQDDLLMAAAAGILRLRRGETGERGIVITPPGRALLAEMRQRLAASGVIAERRRLLAIGHGGPWPLPHAALGFQEVWEELLSLAGVQAGGRVLVLGLALGGEALVRQIAERVGPGGSVLVVDPAVSVLRHWTARLAQKAPPQVRLLPGRPEALPLSDDAVDACLAPAFLHLAEHGQALAEVRRVVRPGGRIAVAVPHAVDTAHGLLREWLQPLLDLAERLDLSEADRPQGVSGRLAEALERHGFTGLLTQRRALPVSPGHVHASAVWPAVLERTPWRERQKVLRELGARAERLWPSAGHVQALGELLIATVPLG